MDIWKKDGKTFENPLIHGGRRIYNPSPEDLTAAGYERVEPSAPEPEDESEPVGRTAFEAACAQFRAVCAQIGEAIGDGDFKGGFDEMIKLQQAPIYNTIQGLQMANAWSALNELCKYEGAKIGLGQPEWWRDCWRQIDAEAEA